MLPRSFGFRKSGFALNLKLGIGNSKPGIFSNNQGVELWPGRCRSITLTI